VVTLANLEIHPLFASGARRGWQGSRRVAPMNLPSAPVEVISSDEGAMLGAC
jgi:hypothetical protein